MKWKMRRWLARLLDQLVVFLVPESTNLQYLQKLERRIHNQRVALRDNWMIVEMRRTDYCGTLRPLKSMWWNYVKKQNATIRELQEKLDERPRNNT